MIIFHVAPLSNVYGSFANFFWQHGPETSGPPGPIKRGLSQSGAFHFYPLLKIHRLCKSVVHPIVNGSMTNCASPKGGLNLNSLR